LFAIVSVAAALAIIYWSSRTLAARDRFLCLALGLILAGTLGNLYDRLVFNGVRDFLWVFLKNGEDPPQIIFDWPIFNIADCCLVLGAGLLLVQAFFTQPHVVITQEAVDMAAEPQVAEAK